MFWVSSIFLAVEPLRLPAGVLLAALTVGAGLLAGAWGVLVRLPRAIARGMERSLEWGADRLKGD